MARRRQPTPVPSSEARSEALRAQPKEALIALLEELAAGHAGVEARLDRLALADDSVQLATGFRSRLQGWKESTRFLGRSGASGFGRELQHWLDEVEHELLPVDPVLAHNLADGFLQADKRFFEQADDSDGAIGDAVRAGCRLWLTCAKAQPDRNADFWVERIYGLVGSDDYGAREELLATADTLFDDAGLRSLAGRFEAALTNALAVKGEADQYDYSVFKAAAAIGLVADALGDPDLSTRTTLRYSPDPNPLQKEHFAERYLRFGRPQDALHWLEGDWGYAEEKRQRLLAEAYAALSDADRLRAVRQALFERTGAASDFHAWHEVLSPVDREVATERARQEARAHSDPVSGAHLYLALGDATAAEQLLVDRSEDVDGSNYAGLVPLVQALESAGRLLGAVVGYRALLTAILGRGYTRAYSHAADYLHALRRLDARVRAYGRLPTHQTFETSIRSAHSRKISFWNRVRSP